MADTVSKTIRYPPHLDATEVLQGFVIHDWQPTDDRGQEGKTKDRTRIIVYTEAKQVKVMGTASKVEKWYKPIAEKLTSLLPTEATDDYLDPLLTAESRGYIERVCQQINICFLFAAFDGAAVLIRRLSETLIIEVFEANGTAAKIKNERGDFLQLSDLIQRAISESNDPSTAWNLSTNAKKALADLKTLGDLSAHNRTFNAKKSDIDRVRTGLRVLTQEMLTIAGIK